MVFLPVLAAQLVIDDARIITPKADDEVKPGDFLEVSFAVENDGEEIMKDVQATITILLEEQFPLREEQGDIIELEANFGEVEGGEREEASLKFRVPFDVKDQEHYTVFISVEGRNASRDKIIVNDTSEDFRIDKLPHDVIFEAFLFRPNSMQCGEQTFLIFVARNIGNDNEEDIRFSVQEDALGISLAETFDLDKDYDEQNTFAKTFRSTLPRNVPPGIYDVKGRMVYDQGKEMTETFASLTVSCTPEPVEEEQKETVPTPPLAPPPQQEQREERVEETIPAEGSEEIMPTSEKQNRINWFIVGVIIEILFILLALFLLWRVRRK